LTNFEPDDRITKSKHTDTADDTHNEQEEFELLRLIKIIRDANSRKEVRRGKSSDSFSDNDNELDVVEDKDAVPDHIKRFFLPAKRIIPRQYKRKGKNKIKGEVINHDPYAPLYDFEDNDEHEDEDKHDPYAPMYDFEYNDELDEEDTHDPYAPMYDFEYNDVHDGDGVDCYTHTMILEGQCWVLCDKTLLRPCNSTISRNV